MELFAEQRASRHDVTHEVQMESVSESLNVLLTERVTAHRCGNEKAVTLA